MASTTPLQVYRHILRACNIAFKGDVATLTQARHTTRQNFEANRDLADQQEIFKQLEHGEEVAVFLRKYIVQGVKEGDEETYKLNIHEEIERNENYHEKNPRVKTGLEGRDMKFNKGAPVQCCGGAGGKSS